MDRALRRRIANSIFIASCAVATLIALTALLLIFWSLFFHGFGGLTAKIFTTDSSAGADGGLLDGIIGSILMCLLGMVIAVIVGILAGTYLAEYAGTSRFGGVVRFLNDVLLSAPSILIGLTLYAILVKPFGDYSAIAGGCALAILATPIVVRTTEDMLNLQSSALREAGMALGAARGLVIRQIIWRASRTGLLTGVLLGFARISGETAPLIFTAFGNNIPLQQVSDVFHKTSALPLLINQFANSAGDDLRNLAWVGALLISLAVLIVNILGRWLARGVRH